MTGEKDRAELITVTAQTLERMLRGADCLSRPDEGLDTALMSRLGESGMLQAHLPEMAAASGAGWRLLGEVMFALGGSAARVPALERALALWLAETAGLSIPDDACLTFSTSPLQLSGDRVSGEVEGIPWAEDSSHLVAVCGSGEAVALVPLADAEVVHTGFNLARESRVRLRYTQATADCSLSSLQEEECEVPLYLAAFLSACSQAGMLEAAMDMAISHVQQREQFGRPLASFQAIQQQIAAAAAEAVAVRSMALAAADALDESLAANPGFAGVMEVRHALALAKLRASMAVPIVLDVAHQVHGAIGLTQEYPLGRFSRRLWGYRDEYGSASFWSQRLGAIWSANVNKGTGAVARQIDFWDFATRVLC